MNDVKLFGVSQVIISGEPFEVLQPLLSVGVRTCSLPEHLPYNTTRTAGLRRIRPEDVPRALALTNQYSSQYKIGQVFQSEEEFSHWFLCPSVPDHVTTYVVEDSISGDITDMFSFKCLEPIFQVVQAVITTKSPIRDIVIDLLVCLQQRGVTEVLFAIPDIEKYLPPV